MQFLSYKSIRIEDERIKVIKNWPELKSVQDISVFIGFANFYQRFNRGFIKIAAPLIFMLKTTKSSDLALKKLETDKFVTDGDKNDNRNTLKKLKNAKSKL